MVGSSSSNGVTFETEACHWTIHAPDEESCAHGCKHCEEFAVLFTMGSRGNIIWWVVVVITLQGEGWVLRNRDYDDNGYEEAKLTAGGAPSEGCGSYDYHHHHHRPPSQD